MRILLGAADRDLLSCYTQLLSARDCTVETAFDGTQVMSKLGTQHFDLLIVSQSIPRVKSQMILKACTDKEIPVILLLRTRLPMKTLLATPLANAYLSFPFLPEELLRQIDSVTEKAKSESILQFDGFAVYVSQFSLETLPVTAGELDVLAKLHAGEPVTDETDGQYIGALNARLAKLEVKHRIRYRKNIGYRMVTEDE